MVYINSVIGRASDKMGEVIERLISLGYFTMDAREAVCGLPDLLDERLKIEK